MSQQGFFATNLILGCVGRGVRLETVKDRNWERMLKVGGAPLGIVNGKSPAPFHFGVGPGSANGNTFVCFR